MGALAKINHVVVLMLENRSFDCLLGKLYPKSAGFDGLAGTETNPGPGGAPIQVWSNSGTDPVSMSVPDPDPGELFTDMNTQLFAAANVPAPAPVPTMSGFVGNYLAQTDKPPGSYSAQSVMHYYTPEQVPVLSRLARQFAVSDRWHASAPCQTWPNRFFVHTATANGYENNDPTHFPYEMPTIFNRFEGLGLAWKVYFHDMPQSLTLSKLWLHASHFRLYPEFQHDAKYGLLPPYSFIEPRYFADVALPNDMHPPHVVTLGEQLLADVYNSLRGGKNWQETLLIVTFDEHGGCHDHVPPPAAIPPSDTVTAPFNFDRYGVRVPALVISPYVAQGKILRPDGPVPFDHTSIIATLRKRFSLGPALSRRDDVAPDLDAALSLASPDNMGPPSVEALPYVPSPADIANAQAAPLNHMQKGLMHLAANLPDATAAAATGDVASFINNHIAKLNQIKAQNQRITADVDQTILPATQLIKQRLGNFFKGME